MKTPMTCETEKAPKADKAPKRKEHLFLSPTRLYCFRELLGTVSNPLVAYWRKTGKLPYTKIHGRFYYRGDDIAPLLRGNLVDVDFV